MAMFFRVAASCGGRTFVLSPPLNYASAASQLARSRPHLLHCKECHVQLVVDTPRRHLLFVLLAASSPVPQSVAECSCVKCLVSREIKAICDELAPHLARYAEAGGVWPDAKTRDEVDRLDVRLQQHYQNYRQLMGKPVGVEDVHHA